MHKAPRPVSLAVLVAALCTTVLFAIVNSIQEELPSMGFAIFVTLLAGLSQFPGILVAYVRWRRQSNTTAPFLFAAYAVATTGTLAYGYHAFNGKADSLNTAAHMHVIMFSILHCVLAMILYLVAGIMAGTALSIHSKSDNTAHPQSPLRETRSP